MGLLERLWSLSGLTIGSPRGESARRGSVGARTGDHAPIEDGVVEVSFKWF
jgi:hypothetical protein